MTPAVRYFLSSRAIQHWIPGEWPFTLGVLALSRSHLVGLPDPVSQYNWTTKGVWSSLTEEEALAKNLENDRYMQSNLRIARLRAGYWRNRLFTEYG